MKWRWLLLDYVDPQLALTRAQRRRVRRRAWDLGLRPVPQTKPVSERSFWDDLTEGRPWPHALVSVLQFILPYTILVVVAFLWLHVIGLRSPSMVVPMYAIIIGLSWIVVALLWRITWRPRVLQALRELGYDVCGRCGYWLKGLDEATDRCPECGARREAPP